MNLDELHVIQFIQSVDLLLGKLLNICLKTVGDHRFSLCYLHEEAWATSVCLNTWINIHHKVSFTATCWENCHRAATQAEAWTQMRGGKGKEKKKENRKKKGEGEDEDGATAKFLSIFIMVHFSFYQSQRCLRRLARCTGTHTNTDVHMDI